MLNYLERAQGELDGLMVFQQAIDDVENVFGALKVKEVDNEPGHAVLVDDDHVVGISGEVVAAFKIASFCAIL